MMVMLMVERLVQRHLFPLFPGFNSLALSFLHLSWCFESLVKHRCIKDVAGLTLVGFVVCLFYFLCGKHRFYICPSEAWEQQTIWCNAA